MNQPSKKRPAKRRETKAAPPTPKTVSATGKKKAAPVASKKASAPRTRRTTTPAPALPRTYGFETLFLIAQDPHWLFTYWDIDISRHPGGQTFLRCFRGQQLEKEIEVPFETRNWYIPVSTAGVQYHVELGYYRGENWNAIAVSDPVETPPENLSESENFDFATVPLHLSFSKLMENIQQSIESGESLVSALSRLQRDGKLLPLQPADFANLGADEKMVLESLLGRDFLSSFSGSSLSSHELQELIRKRLEERLNSETGGSEWLASWGGAAKAESSLFGVLQALAGPTSWSTGALSSWAAAALMSWAAAARGVTSWGAAGQSGAAAAASSWGPESLTSWLKAAASSWSQAAISSWSQETLTSWTKGESSSWSGQPFGGSREFFMHVNAELIFYGGTHPDARVTIDGKTIKLAPDGTFRYHFVFPNGDYEIPIVATSPDGVETRRAVLRFERETGKAGVVADTPQPPLGEPMGRVA